MADPITPKLREIVKKVLELERSTRKKGAGIAPEDIAVKCLREIIKLPPDPALLKIIPGCEEILPAFPLLYAAAKSCDLEQLTRQELRRWPEEKGFGSRKEGGEGGGDTSGVREEGESKDSESIEPPLPGFEELVKKYKDLHPEYPKAHKKGEKPRYVEVHLMEQEDYNWNIRFGRNLVGGLHAHNESLAAFALNERGWPEPKPDEDKDDDEDIEDIG